MLKFFYRLKRRGGAVLFAVIAIMSLLIAMAITAYFTARSSYNTVVSNYDFSQTYLSAISVSDMMIEALTQDTYAEKDASNNDINKFDALKNAVRSLKTSGVGTTVTGRSSNIATDPISEAANKPVCEGVLDAVTVEITYLDATSTTIGSLTKTRHKYEIKTTAYYRDNEITVTDMIANDTTVQTSTSSTPGSSSSNHPTPFNTFFTATGQLLAGTSTAKDHSRVVTIKSHQISDNAYFENDVTVFPNGNNNDFYGGITATGDVYIDKFVPHIPAPTATSRHDWWIGGDFVFGSNANNVNLNGNNLYVGGNLVMGGNGATLSAGDVYVKGDLYVVSGGSPQINGNVYVEGNVYYIADSDLTDRVNEVGKKTETSPGNSWSGTYIALNTPSSFNVSGEFKVNGEQTGIPEVQWVNTGKKDQWGNDIWGPVPTGNYNKVGSQNTGSWDMSDVNINVSSTVADTNADKYKEEITETSLETGMNAKFQNTDFETFTANEKTLNNSVTIDLDEIGGRPVPADAIAYSQLIKSKEEGGYGGSFVEEESGNLSLPNGSTLENGTYTFSQSASGGNVVYKKEYKNSTGKVVYSEECTIASDGTVIVTYDDGTKVKATDTGAEYTMKDGTVITATVGSKGGKTLVTLDVPYNSDGYLLGLDLGSYADGNTSMEYNFNVPDKGKTMPVVLKANYNDGSDTATDENGNNSFSWRQGDQGNGCTSDVKLTGDGNVMFELGNYNKDDGKYVSYVPESTSTTLPDGTKVDIYDYTKLQNEVETAKYFICQKETVGTEKQVDKVEGNWQNSSTIQGMLNTGTSTPASGYEDRIMLVSNKNGGVAIENTWLDNTFCGYLYAPNGVYDQGSRDTGGNTPVFGGMIVSSYSTMLSNFIYCEPQPSVISQLLGSMTQYTPGGGSSSGTKTTTTTTTEGIWVTNGIGKNYLG